MVLATPGRIPSLDGLRALSIFPVFVGHFWLVSMEFAYLGVTVFFVISGYVITRGLIYEHQQSNGRIALGRFYLRRCLRLYPALLLVLGLVSAGVLFDFMPGELKSDRFFSMIFYYHNYYRVYVDYADLDGLGVLWTLAVEEHFYLLFPILFITLYRNIRLFLLFLAATIVVSLCLRAVYLLVFDLRPKEIILLTEARIDSITFGCLAAVAERFAWWQRLIRSGVAAYLLTLTLLPLLLLTLFISDPVFRVVFSFPLYCSITALLIGFSVNFGDSLLFRPLNWWPMVLLGHWSYGFYLLHDPVIKTFWHWQFARPSVWADALLPLLVSLALSAFVYHAFEHPFRVLRSRIGGRAAKQQMATD